MSEVVAGSFREDLFARLNLWTFTLPGLADRREDIAPNLDYELERFAEREGARVTFNKEARRAYIAFAESPAASWQGNFRDLASSVTRMATLCPDGRIDTQAVDHERDRLAVLWAGEAAGSSSGVAFLERLIGSDRLASIDPFDQVQLEFVIRTCHRRSSRRQVRLNWSARLLLG